MIVTCERCATQFQLDDERVPEDGVRVRCSRCKHAFFIERPARNEAEKIHRIARRALEDGPEVTEDLDGAADAPPGGDELDEEDWQFADDAPFGGDDVEDPAGLSAAAAVVDDLLGGSGSSGQPSSVFDAGGLVDDGIDDDASPLALEEDDEPLPISAHDDVPGIDDIGLEDSDSDVGLSIDDERETSATEAYQDPGAVSIDAEEDGGSGLDLDGTEPADDAADLLADLRDELEEELAAAPAPLAEVTPARSREVVTQPAVRVAVNPEQDELEDLDDWGLAEDTESPTVATGLTMPTRTVARVPTEIEDEPSARAQWLVRAGNFVGWFCVLGLFGFGLHSGISIQPVVAPASPESVHVGGFDVSEVNTHWIDNLHVGPMLVVSGTVRNTAALAETGLAVILLGDDGEPISELASVVGPALGESTLRGVHPDAFVAAQRALEVDGWPWRSGQERRFHAVAGVVADTAAWVRFDALDGARVAPLGASGAPAEQATQAIPLEGAEAVATEPSVEPGSEIASPVRAGPSTPL